MFSLLARSVTLKRLASRYGMTPNGFARRFIAGETVHEAIEAARATAGPRHARRARLPRRKREHDQGRDGRLTRVRAAHRNHRRVGHRAQHLAEADAARPDDRPRDLRGQPPAHPRTGQHATSSSSASTWRAREYTQLTLDVFETLWSLEFRNIGIALQSSLHRTEQDVRRMNELGARVRLVKGAYKEPASVAFQQKADVDAAYTAPDAAAARSRRLSGDRHARRGDHRGDAQLRRRTAPSASDRYEFQMLYGIRRDLQTSLVAEGYRMRVYIPFGKEWFPVLHAPARRTARQRGLRAQSAAR